MIFDLAVSLCYAKHSAKSGKWKSANQKRTNQIIDSKKWNDSKDSNK